MALWLLLLLVPALLAGAQDLRERDALCSAEGCYAVYFQRRTFLESWRVCRERGGNLATPRHPEEAALIEELFGNLGVHEDQATMRFWIGLQRQPRQCSPTRPLRGFTWVTGDQDTLYTNWLRPEGAPGGTCAASRCVVMSYGASRAAQAENFRWLEGSCTLPVDGFVCKFAYKGMCPGIVGEGGPVMYTTPFHLVSTLLTYVPFGSVASVPCGGGGVPDLAILCMLKEDGTIGWSKDDPYCPEEQQSHRMGLHELSGVSSCDQDNGGCEHICVDEGKDYFCECDEGYALMEDGQSCALADHCESNPCEVDCTSDGRSYHCSCPEGYELASDGRSCQDVDECAKSSCDQLCLNYAGGYECQCHLGYHLEDGQCRDADECATQAPCEHSCENTAGSYACHCNLGFSPAEEDPHHCVDTDECRIANMCEQMCVNYIGGFECYCNDGYELDDDGISCNSMQEAGDAGEDRSFEPITLMPPSPETWPWDYSEEETDSEGLVAMNTPESKTPSQEITTVRTLTTTMPSSRTTPEAADTTVGLKEWTSQHESTSKAIDTTTTTTRMNMATSTDSTPVQVFEEAVVDDLLPETDSPISEEVVSTPEAPRWKPAGTSSISPPEDATLLEGSMLSVDSVRLEFRDHPGTTLASTLPSMAASSPASLPGSEGSHRAVQKRDDRWLLVALLVPLCIFLVIMLALGIVYCTRCGAKAKPKSVTDCYRWITNKNPSATAGKLSA
ncbi:endosialin [Ambystoma mexicanum]|uniref:endosialin n=1 Tax=Ambystoma mexicanum TaxID=8296 RepID=UPI0037E80C42